MEESLEMEIGKEIVDYSIEKVCNKKSLPLVKYQFNRIIYFVTEKDLY